MLTVKDLHKSYQVGKTTYEVLKGVSLTVEKGEFVAVMGPSGSGKTTLLNCISCYIPIDSGEIMLGDRQLANLSEDALAKVRNRQLGFVFQDCNLLDTLTAYENIALALTIRKTPVRQVDPLVKETAQLLEITECLNKYPYQMSGGQQQRTAAARAIITQPALILADEPTGALDSRTGKHVLEILHGLHEEGTTIILITHDNGIAATAERVVRISDGHIIYDGDREGAFA